jgi:putative oxidoreductase
MKIIAKEDVALLVLRLVGLGMAFGHGWGKIVALSAGRGDGFIGAVAGLGFPAPGLFAWAAALAEFVGGLCVALGLGTRVASGFAAFTMLVAAFGRHQAHRHLLVTLGLDRASEETIKAWGNPELALVYLVVFLTITVMGPGRLALDQLIRKR